MGYGDQGGYHKQLTQCRLAHCCQFIPCGQGVTELPSTVFRVCGAVRAGLLSGPAGHCPALLYGQPGQAQGVGVGPAAAAGHVHHPDGHLHPSLRHPHGLDWQPDGQHAIPGIPLLLLLTPQVALPDLAYPGHQHSHHPLRTQPLRHRHILFLPCTRQGLPGLWAKAVPRSNRINSLIPASKHRRCHLVETSNFITLATDTCQERGPFSINCLGSCDNRFSQWENMLYINSSFIGWNNFRVTWNDG